MLQIYRIGKISLHVTILKIDKNTNGLMQKNANKCDQ